MKLILKRVGGDPRMFRKPEARFVPDSRIIDHRPFALCTEDGEQLPCQRSTSMSSDGNGIVTLTVVFEVDGRDLLVQGDLP